MFTKQITLPAANGAAEPSSSAGQVTTPSSMLQKIRRAKYPAVTEAEEAISLPLQTLAQAHHMHACDHIATHIYCIPTARACRRSSTRCSCTSPTPSQSIYRHMRACNRWQAIFDAVLVHIANSVSIYL